MWVVVIVVVLVLIMTSAKKSPKKKEDIVIDKERQLNQAIKVIESVYDYASSSIYDFGTIMMRGDEGKQEFTVWVPFVGNDFYLTSVTNEFEDRKTKLISSLGTSGNYGSMAVEDELCLVENEYGLWICSKFSWPYSDSWTQFQKKVIERLKGRHPDWRIADELPFKISLPLKK